MMERRREKGRDDGKKGKGKGNGKKANSCKKEAKRSEATGDFILLKSARGQTMLRESELEGTSHWKDFEPFLCKQKHRTFCGVATSVILLNYLAHQSADEPIVTEEESVEKKEEGNVKEEGEKGKEDVKDSTKGLVYSEESFFSLEATTKVLNTSTAKVSGMSLRQLSKLLESHGLTVNRYHADEKRPANAEGLRSQVKTIFSPFAKSCLAVNFHMETLGQGPYDIGHISPIVAYHEKSDRLLLADVWPNTPYSWVLLEDMWTAMHSVADPVSGVKRGWVLVSSKK